MFRSPYALNIECTNHILLYSGVSCLPYLSSRTVLFCNEQCTFRIFASNIEDVTPEEGKGKKCALPPHSQFPP